MDLPNNNEELKNEEQQAENIKQTMSPSNLPATKKLKVVDHLKNSLVSRQSYSSTPLSRLKKIGNTIFSINGRLLVPKVNVLTGRHTGEDWPSQPPYKWCAMPPHPIKISSREIASYDSGAIGVAKEVKTEVAAFDIFINEDMLNKILTYTNHEIRILQYYLLPNPNVVYPLTMSELKAFVGILFLSAVKQDQKLSTSFPWGPCCSDVYQTVMSKERFEYLAVCLRFDEFSTRDIRKSRDAFYSIREIWNLFIDNCTKVFRPSVNCIIDEMFVNYNGYCAFKVPLPEEPNKYGINLILLCDSINHYIVSGIPYINKGKNKIEPNYIVANLTKPIHGTNINITYGTDRFTSVALSKNMLKLYKLSTIGPLHKSHLEIPADMLLLKERPVGSTIFAYNIEDELQLCTYCSKSDKVDVFISNIHFQSVIKPEGIPEVLANYIKNKRGGDTITKMCQIYSCSRKTGKWFIAIFYKILDLAGINSLTILNQNRIRCGQSPLRRVDFIYNLALDLMIPYLKERLLDPLISNPLKDRIESVIRERQKWNNMSNLPMSIWTQIQDKYSVNEPNHDLFSSDVNTKVMPLIFKKETPQIINLEGEQSTKPLSPKVELQPIVESNANATNVIIQDSDLLLRNQNEHSMNGSEDHDQSISSDTNNEDTILYIKADKPQNRHLNSQVNETIRTAKLNLQPNISNNNVSLNQRKPDTQKHRYSANDSNRDENAQKADLTLLKQINTESHSNTSPKPVTSTMELQENIGINVKPKNVIKQGSQCMPESTQSLNQPSSLNIAAQQIKKKFPPLPSVRQSQPQIGFQDAEWGLIRSFYAAVQSNKINPPLAPGPNSGINSTNFTIQQTQPIYRPIQFVMPRPQITPFPNSWNALNYTIMQPMQSLYSPNHNASYCQALMPAPGNQRNPLVPIADQKVSEFIRTAHELQQNYQARPPIMKIEPATNNMEPKHNLPQQMKHAITQIVANLKTELSACGICDSICDKNFLVECIKCSVLLCIVHRKILCVNCVDVKELTPPTFKMGPPTTVCGVCQTQRIQEDSSQCCKCAKYLCYEDRRMLCCFCSEM